MAQSTPPRTGTHAPDQTGGATNAPSGDRIAKLLARAGVASRREIERMIDEGRIAVDGKVLDTPATVLKSLRGVTVDGQPVAQPEPTRLFLYHKPTGLLVTERDPKGRPTIYDRLPRDLPRLVPVGRLDLNTEGLLLLTTDGGFKRQLELPATGVERSYRARAYGNVTQQQLEELAEGVEIEGIRYGSIDANIERRTGANVWIEITITEGKNREVRRVLEHLGLQVSRLIRTRYGPFVLGDLPMGGIGEVKQHEIVGFRKTLKGGAPDEPVSEAPRAGFRTAPTVDRAARTRARAVEAPHETSSRASAGEGRRGAARMASPRDGAASHARPMRRTVAGADDSRQDGRRDAIRPRTVRGDERGAGARPLGDARKSERNARPDRGGTSIQADRTRPARPERPGRRPRDEAPFARDVPTGGSSMKPWERADDRASDRGGDRNAERSRGGDAARPGRGAFGQDRFGQGKAGTPRSGARPPRGDGPTRGTPRPSGGGPRGGTKGGPKGGRR